MSEKDRVGGLPIVWNIAEVLASSEVIISGYFDPHTTD